MNRPNFRQYGTLARIAGFSAAVSFASSALAHVFPQQQVPGAGATVASPKQISITFDGPLEPAFSKLTVDNAKGQPVATSQSHVASDKPKVMTLALPALATGRYTVHWVAVALDGHRTHGDYSFLVK